MRTQMAILRQLYCQWESMVLEKRDKAQQSTMTTLNYLKWFSLPKEVPQVIKKILQKPNFKWVMRRQLEALEEVAKHHSTNKNRSKIIRDN